MLSCQEVWSRPVSVAAELDAAGMTLLLVEQNAVKSLGISDRVYVLELGRNRFTGTGADLLADDRVRRLYLGG